MCPLWSRPLVYWRMLRPAVAVWTLPDCTESSRAKWNQIVQLKMCFPWSASFCVYCIKMPKDRNLDIHRSPGGRFKHDHSTVETGVWLKAMGKPDLCVCVLKRRCAYATCTASYGRPWCSYVIGPLGRFILLCLLIPTATSLLPFFKVG